MRELWLLAVATLVTIVVSGGLYLLIVNYEQPNVFPQDFSEPQVREDVVNNKLGVLPFLSVKNQPELITENDFFSPYPGGYRICRLVVKDGNLYVRFGLNTFDPYVITDDIENVLIYSKNGEEIDISNLCEEREVAYIIDSFNVYSLSKKTTIQTASIETFSPLPVSEEEWRTYFTDTEKIFDIYGNIYDEIDVETFGFKNGFWADKNAVYFQDRSNGGVLVALPNSDPKTFELLGAGFSKDAHTVFYDDGSVLNDADPNSFKYVGGGRSEGYAKDTVRVWFGSTLRNRATLISDADASTFEYIGEYDREQYAKDEKKIYRNGSHVYQGADPSTFRHVASLYGGSIYFKDSKNVYGYRNALNFGISPEGFEPFVAGYIKDAFNVFFIGSFDKEWQVIEEADPKTFSEKEVLDASGNSQKYFADKNKIYFRHYCSGRSLEDCKKYEDSIYLPDLVVTNSWPRLFKDTDTVLYVTPGYEGPSGIAEMRGVHVPTYEVLGTCATSFHSTKHYAKDKNGIYIHGVAESVEEKLFDQDTFTLFEHRVLQGPESGLDLYFAKDKNGVYVGCNKKLEGIDPQEFTISPFDTQHDGGVVGIVTYKGVEYYAYPTEKNGFTSVDVFLEPLSINELSTSF